MQSRLLVIDDDALVRRAVCRPLRCRHHVIDVPDVESALGLLRSGDRFEMILVDLHLGPGGSAADLLAEIELVDPDQAQHVVFHTGGPNCGADRALLETHPVIYKPSTTDDIERALESLIDVYGQAA